jgi:RHS repeat-associated protein
VWALADHQGTVRDLIDDGGNVVEHLSYDSFGNLSSTPTFDFRYGYTGREQDSETGLDYYRARYYDSAVGRFISEDPIGFAAGDSNIYRYVGNSPVNFVDPSGLQSATLSGESGFNPVTAISPLVEGLGSGIYQGLDWLTKGSGLNPLPTGVGRNGLVLDQPKPGTIPTLTPPLQRPVPRPTQSPSPSPSPSLTSPPPNPNICPNDKKKTCKTKYPQLRLCSEIQRGTGGGESGILTGYKYDSWGQVQQLITTTRTQQGKTQWWREEGIFEEAKASRSDSFCPGYAKHQNVEMPENFTRIFPGSKGFGSLGECTCCDDSNTTEPVQKYSILNIKNSSGNKLQSNQLK